MNDLKELGIVVIWEVVAFIVIDSLIFLGVWLFWPEILKRGKR